MKVMPTDHAHLLHYKQTRSSDDQMNENILMSEASIITEWKVNDLPKSTLTCDIYILVYFPPDCDLPATCLSW